MLEPQGDNQHRQTTLLLYNIFLLRPFNATEAANGREEKIRDNKRAKEFRKVHERLVQTWDKEEEEAQGCEKARSPPRNDRQFNVQGSAAAAAHTCSPRGLFTCMYATYSLVVSLLAHPCFHDLRPNRYFFSESTKFIDTISYSDPQLHAFFRVSFISRMKDRSSRGGTMWNCCYIFFDEQNIEIKVYFCHDVACSSHIISFLLLWYKFHVT